MRCKTCQAVKTLPASKLLRLAHVCEACGARVATRVPNAKPK